MNLHTYKKGEIRELEEEFHFNNGKNVEEKEEKKNNDANGEMKKNKKN